MLEIELSTSGQGKNSTNPTAHKMMNAFLVEGEIHTILRDLEEKYTRQARGICCKGKNILVRPEIREAENNRPFLNCLEEYFGRQRQVGRRSDNPDGV